MTDHFCHRGRFADWLHRDDCHHRHHPPSSCIHKWGFFLPRVWVRACTESCLVLSFICFSRRYRLYFGWRELGGYSISFHAPVLYLIVYMLMSIWHFNVTFLFRFIVYMIYEEWSGVFEKYFKYQRSDRRWGVQIGIAFLLLYYVLLNDFRRIIITLK